MSALKTITIASAGSGDDTYQGGAGTDTISYTCSTHSIIVDLGEGSANGQDIGNDILISIENVIGGQVNDSLTGNGEDNILDGYLGVDTLTGGFGNDTYIVNVTTDIVVETLNAGTDLVKSSAIYTLPNNVENLTLIGALAINGQGNALANIIIGNSNNNILNGGGGNDTLTGGGGKDSFLFNTAINLSKDTITDFSSIDDTIQLENLIFTKLSTTGTLNIANFKIGVSAADSNDYIIYNQSTGALFYDADANGAGAAMQIALIGVASHPVLSVADFVVI